MADVVCMGELLIDFVPTETGRGLADADTFQKAAGGAPANVAVGLTRLGVTSAFMGKVGADGFGTFLADTLAEAGVDTTPLTTTTAALTALAFVSLRADGEREFLFYRSPSADMLFAPTDVDAASLAACRIFHFGSLSLIAEPSRAGTLAAVEAAKAAGARISYDPNLRLHIWPDAEAARAGMRQGLAQAHIVKIAADEVAFLTGEADPIQGARALWHDELELMAVTLGARGSIWLTAEAEGHAPGMAVTAVDTTGAGDAYMAGLVAGWLASPDRDPATLDRLCRFANAVGALTASARGAIPALPTRAAVDAFLAGSRP